MNHTPTKSLPGWTHVKSGKVRDLYAPTELSTHDGRDTVLIVASDRISAFDYVLPTPIPGKGKVLTAMALWWFEQLKDVTPNHFVSTDVPEAVRGRAMITNRLEMVPVECVVRGYITGSALAEYRRSGSICGIELPEGLEDCDRLPEPIFTPAAKAESGEHDVNITYADVERMVGRDVARTLKDTSLALYWRARTIAASKGIILADTKFEFGRHTQPGATRLVLGDEILTPDSSRFWDESDYVPGQPQPSLDKQYIRDWLTSEEAGWDRVSPPPELPTYVVEKTKERYVRAYERLTGRTWEE
ncbi:phosphoribosylaminoimidazolesuccinocarboxamide synthase [Flaviflexus huanghaiensis]|uniref:phosphoribosylaminoimidazolesuccinocarboxamide synthase n=1 Tax=Flaviflexus huanghaiensis TaxID=1111473 RepID=UPI0015F98F2F|nr:phosphoribosylaminoimidazolesuccinocarboxamide synthase [Flaviflexus huanghaiensis]